MLWGLQTEAIAYTAEKDVRIPLKSNLRIGDKFKYTVHNQLEVNEEGEIAYKGKANFDISFQVIDKIKEGWKVYVQLANHTMSHNDVYGRKYRHSRPDATAVVIWESGGKIRSAGKSPTDDVILSTPHSFVRMPSDLSHAPIGEEWTIRETLTDPLLCPEGVAISTTWRVDRLLTTSTGRRVAILKAKSTAKVRDPSKKVASLHIERSTLVELDADKGTLLNAKSETTIRAKGKNGRTLNRKGTCEISLIGWKSALGAKISKVAIPGCLGDNLRTVISGKNQRQGSLFLFLMSFAFLVCCYQFCTLGSRRWRKPLVYMIIFALVSTPVMSNIAIAQVGNETFEGFYHGKEAWSDGTRITFKEPTGAKWKPKWKLKNDYLGYDKRTGFEYWRNPHTGQIAGARPALYPGFRNSQLCRWTTMPVTGVQNISDVIFTVATDTLGNLWDKMVDIIAARKVPTTTTAVSSGGGGGWTWLILGGGTAAVAVAAAGRDGGTTSDDDDDDDDDDSDAEAGGGGGGGGTGGLSDVTVSQRNITLTVWDHQVIDGDIIDLIVNGTYLLTNHTLVGPPGTTVNATLNSGNNTIIVHADNTGWTGPNTAALEISHVTTGEPSQVWSVGLNEDASLVISAP